ncbi:hypothetical protein NDU88_004330 [Pleurodeles waltl]|uniref:Uncharacterized protein n=1 Tax=Pleurodeles waltl TaxID=8319 RepID=A0AAV7PKP0_PLEWA|nr:hypothetical protein NDU88_004330 [Pleurodeles waltl]
MARSIDLDRPGPPCIKEEVNPASVGRTTAATEYCVSLQRLWADCGVTAGNSAELPFESHAVALSMDEADWSLPCALWYQANGVRSSGEGGALVVPRVVLSVGEMPPFPCLYFPYTDGLLVRLVPGPLPRSPPPTRAPAGKTQGAERGGRRGADSPMSSGTPRRPSPSATAPTRSFPLTHRNAASSSRRSIYAVVVAWAQTRARSANLLPCPAKHPERSPGVTRRFPHIPDDLSPHSGSAPRQNLHYRRAGDRSSRTRRPPS